MSPPLLYEHRMGRAILDAQTIADLPIRDHDIPVSGDALLVDPRFW
jgi:hypothetical protein